MEQRRNQEVGNMEEPIPIRSSSSLFDSFITSTNHVSTSFLDLENHWNIGSIGFMDLLGVVENDFCSSTNTTTTTTTTSGGGGVFQEEPGQHHRRRSVLPPPYYKSDNPNSNNYTTAAAAALPPESSDVVNAPTTPNSSSSISSESIICAAAAAPAPAPMDELPKPANEEKTKKHSLKPKKTNQKRPKEPRFAFMTESQVDHLEDGYRWRKYGQKAVKNSPFPRSYYRCTSTSCNVKKRVERSFNDSSIVVTTYEGQHTHPTPIIHRPTPQSSAFLFTNPTAVPPHIATLSRQLQLNSHVMAVAPVHLNSGFTSSRDIFTGALGKRFSASDDGLLQDIVPSASTVRKEDDIL